MLRAETTALIYTRVSKEDMAKEGLSLPAQLDACRRYAVARGWILGQHFEDHMTGRRADRPAYQNLLEEARRLRRLGRQATVVVARLDRFGRKLKEQITARDELRAIDIVIHTVKEGGEVSDLVANVLGAVAQQESERLSERVRDVREHLTAKGWWPVGRVAWGWRLRDATPEERSLDAPQRVLIEDPSAGPAVRELFRRVADGQSIRQAARWARGLDPDQRGEYLDGDGVLHPARPLSFQRIRKLLRSPMYAARQPVADGVDALAQPVQRWPSLVDDRTWARVQERIGTHERHPRQASGRYLMTGYLRCPKCRERGCDVRMCGLPYRDGSPRYMCNDASQGGCSFAIVGRTLDRSVLDQVGALVEYLTTRDQTALRRAWDRLRQPDDEGDLQRRRDIRAAERRLTEAQRRLQGAQYRLLDGALSAQEYPALRDGLQATIDEAEATLTALRAVKPEATLPPLDQVVSAAGGWRETMATADTASLREVLAALVTSVVPRRIGYGRYVGEVEWTPLGEGLAAMTEQAS